MNQKQNILFILSDDQGSWALGCYGNPEIHTPNLDRLAKEGVRFENFYCTSPVCSPARASILTGKMPSQHGIHDYLCGGNGGLGQEVIEFLRDHVGYTDVLAQNGYECALSGKWHMGAGGKPQKGFSFWYTHQKGGGPYYNAPMFRNGEPMLESEYITDVITDEALNFLNQRDNSRPFYLSVHYTAPHSPWVGCHPQKYVDLYKDCKFNSCPQGEPHPWANIHILPGYKEPTANLQGYFAAVTAMDANIGRLLDYLDEQELTESTLVCFMSDNGFNCGHHGIWGKGNGTFPMNMYDNSVKVPFIMRHTGELTAGKVCSATLSAYDFMPTLLDYVGLETPNAEQLPGQSFVSLLTGEQQQCDRPVVAYDEYGPVRMIRSGQYKLVYRYPYGPHELYDMQHDPDETQNLISSAQHMQIIFGLKKQLEEWFLRYADPRLDGLREPVLGGGQQEWAGTLGNGFEVYKAKEKKN